MSTITEMDGEIRHQKAIKLLAKVKEMEKNKTGYKFVAIDKHTRVYRKHE